MGTGIIRLSLLLTFCFSQMAVLTPNTLCAQGSFSLSRYFYEEAEKRGDLKAAEMHLDRMVKDPDTQLEGLELRSYLRRQTGDTTGAIKDAMAMLRLDRSEPGAHLAMLYSTSMVSSPEEIRRNVDRVVTIFYNDSRVLFECAGLYAALGDFSEAIHRLDQARELLEAMPNPEIGKWVATVQNYKALLLYESGKDSESAALLAELLSKHPDNRDIEETRHEILLAEGRLQEALTSFQRLFRQRPKNDLNTWYDRAQAYFLTGQYAKAQADLEEALRRSPVSAHAIVAISGMMILQGKPAEAEKFLVKNNRILVLDRFGIAASELSRTDINQDRVALDLLGITTKNYYYNRALARALQGKKKLALEDARKSANGVDGFKAFPPAENLVKALESGATIRLQPKPFELPTDTEITTGTVAGLRRN